MPIKSIIYMISVAKNSLNLRPGALAGIDTNGMI
jgi:hypothetical protein